ncbi:MAG: hypothetical protein ACE5GU_11665 [Candidatus Scalinduaceae bacterium]
MPDEIKLNKIGPLKRRETPLDSKRKKDKQEHKHKEKAGDHFQDLAKAAELAHDTLEKNNSPYRFSVYQREGEVFIDIVIIDEDGKIKETKKKNITHEEFSTWLNHIEQGEGLFFDTTV